jgi:hypothetical protein
MDCIARCGVYAESLATRQPVPVIPLSPPHTLALSLLCWTHHHTHKEGLSAQHNEISGSVSLGWVCPLRARGMSFNIRVIILYYKQSFCTVQCTPYVYYT